jgi:hypothetical protein
MRIVALSAASVSDTVDDEEPCAKQLERGESLAGKAKLPHVGGEDGLYLRAQLRILRAELDRLHLAVERTGK